MKIVFRLLAFLLSGAMLWMGCETLLPQFPNFLSNSTAMVFIFVGAFFGFYGITGRSSITQ